MRRHGSATDGAVDGPRDERTPREHRKPDESQDPTHSNEDGPFWDVRLLHVRGIGSRGDRRRGIVILGLGGRQTREGRHANALRFSRSRIRSRCGIRRGCVCRSGLCRCRRLRGICCRRSCSRSRSCTCSCSVRVIMVAVIITVVIRVWKRREILCGNPSHHQGEQQQQGQRKGRPAAQPAPKEPHRDIYLIDRLRLQACVWYRVSQFNEKSLLIPLTSVSVRNGQSKSENAPRFETDGPSSTRGQAARRNGKKINKRQGESQTITYGAKRKSEIDGSGDKRG
ncbi:hypothetical protein VTN02DRAFT_209 [Thermoascus thermophilus]